MKWSTYYFGQTVYFAFHLLQGYWSQNLVDAKVAAVKRYMREKDVAVRVAMVRVLAVKAEEYECKW